MTEKKRPTRKKETPRQRLIRYTLVGGALGLYFGYFFRPVREPSFVLALGLAVLIALVMLIIRLVRKDRPSLAGALRYAARTFVMAALFLLVMEARHLAYDAGGKIAVMAMTTILGALAGLWSARSQGMLTI